MQPSTPTPHTSELLHHQQPKSIAHPMPKAEKPLSPNPKTHGHRITTNPPKRRRPQFTLPQNWAVADQRERAEQRETERKKKKKKREEREDRIKYNKKFIQVAIITCYRNNV